MPEKARTVRLALAGAVLFGALAACSGAPPIQDFGRSPYPVWQPLSAYEIAALHSRVRAARGDWKALLRLALVASGDPRDPSDLRDLESVVADFLASRGPALRRIADTRTRAWNLLQYMHSDILRTKTEGQLAKYRHGQSQLTVVLDDGTYNCISSALLYLVLSRAVGLNTRGVKMPHHAYIELLTAGRRIDIETTSARGLFDHRDAAWFARKGRGWASRRGLSASNWAAYQRRRPISPLGLVAGNMRNQHAHPSRMDETERFRLREIRAELLPRDPQAQIERLNVIMGAHNRLHADDEFEAIVRMYKTVEPALADIARRHGRVRAVRNLLAWHRGHHGTALQRIGRWNLARGWLQATERLLPGIPDARRVEHNVLTTVWREIRKRVERRDFAGAQTAMAPFRPRCVRVGWCAQNLRWLASMQRR